MRTKLIVLGAITPEALALPAGAACAGLSRACHRHAYELAPAHTEVEVLVGYVAGLALMTRPLDTANSRVGA